MTTVHAPFDGWLLALAETPDEAFATGLVGSGVALDPTSAEVLAPFDGVVSALPASRHAVTVQAPNGVEVLIHVGLETVALNGRGFTAHVAEGEAVRTGQRLLSLDLDAIARGARSLISPVVVVEGGAVTPVVVNRSIKAGEPILTVTGAGAAAAHAGSAVTRTLHPDLPHGLHARPAAKIAAGVKLFDASVTLKTGQREAAATSLVGMMGLGFKPGDALTLSAAGPQAQEALDALNALIEAGLEDAGAAPHAPPAAPVAASATRSAEGELILSGAAASPGLAVGRAVRLTPPEIVVPDQGQGAAAEQAALTRALDAVRARLARDGASGGPQRRAILAAHLAFLDDPGLTAAAGQAITGGKSAAAAWRQATRSGVDTFRAMGDARMAERADDLLDLERQVLCEILGIAPPAPRVGPGSVVVADDLLPSQLMALDGETLAGFCTARGGPTSHVAILAQAMGVPAVVALGEALSGVEDGALLVLDADAGRVVVDPSAARQAETQSALASRQRRRAEARALAHEPCHTADGQRVEVFANLGAAAEAAPAVVSGAEGCGLLRTEFLFLHRETAPGEDEQLAEYQAIADALDGRPLIVRTLDAGGDKPLPYLPTPPEENPALGLRGVRSGLHRPDILMTQLRAICRVESKGQVAVMLPMIASVAEVRQVRAMLRAAAADVGRPEPLLGVMVETPAAAVTTDVLAPEIDFVSIGTNDLTQYALAMDRQNAALAAQLDSLHPAVLRLIDQAAKGAAATRWIGVCGGLASEPLAAPILIGLGVTELSVAPAMTAEIKAVVRRLTLSDCQALARQALTLDSAEAVRALAAEHLASRP